MIQEFVDAWYAKKHLVEEKFRAAHPDSYTDVVRYVIEMINPDDEYDLPDPKRIHEINDGSYQGTLVYVIGEAGYQPNTYWYVRVGYGSCSGCDTLEAIKGWDDEPPNDSEVKQYMMLALHVIQGLKKMEGDLV
jgi:hypothetical protein